jgi:hypothetical protein
MDLEVQILIHIGSAIWESLDPDPDIELYPGFNDLKLKKNYNWKFLFLTIRREHPALQNMKILYFFLFFFPPQSGSAI